MVRRRSVVAVVLAVITTACGSGSETSDAKDPRSAVQLAEDRVAASNAILTVADFPSGWESKRKQSSLPTAEREQAEQDFAKCTGIDPALFNTGTRSGAHAQSDEFSDNQSRQVQNSVTIVASRERAEATLAAMRNPEVLRCLSNYVDRAIQTALENADAAPEGVTFGKASVEALSVPGVNTDSVAYRAKVTISSQEGSAEVFVDLVRALKGRTGVSMTFIGFGAPFPVEEEAVLTNKVVDRALST